MRRQAADIHNPSFVIFIGKLFKGFFCLFRTRCFLLLHLFLRKFPSGGFLVAHPDNSVLDYNRMKKFRRRLVWEGQGRREEVFLLLFNIIQFQLHSGIRRWAIVTPTCTAVIKNKDAAECGKVA